MNSFPRSIRCFSTRSSIQASPFSGQQIYRQFARSSPKRTPLYKRPFVRYASLAAVGSGSIFYYANLERVPITNRSRFMIVGPEMEAEISKQSYDEIKQQFGQKILPASHPSTVFVKRVMSKLSAVSGLRDLEWEVHVIDDPTVNAFVIPGGKVFVFSGLLPIARDEVGLATVLSHEVGHQIARHVAEKLSYSPIIGIAQFALAVLLGSFGLGGYEAYYVGGLIRQFVLENPYSRNMEIEADHIGLLLMSQACYDPRGAVKMWERMAMAEKANVPEFMSTHPSNNNRIKHITEWMPEAMETRNNSDCRSALSGFVGAMREGQRQTKW